MSLNQYIDDSSEGNTPAKLKIIRDFNSSDKYN